jgi:hypothetical protein
VEDDRQRFRSFDAVEFYGKSDLSNQHGACDPKKESAFVCHLLDLWKSRSYDIDTTQCVEKKEDHNGERKEQKSNEGKNMSN